MSEIFWSDGLSCGTVTNWLVLRMIWSHGPHARTIHHYTAWWHVHGSWKWNGQEWKSDCNSSAVTTIPHRWGNLSVKRLVSRTMYMIWCVFMLQSATTELSELRDELAACKKERSSLQSKIIQLTTALKSALATKASLNSWSFGSVASPLKHLYYNQLHYNMTSMWLIC